MSKNDLPSVNEALNEYFKLKKKFDENNTKILKKIRDIEGNKNKRAAYLKYMPKCINCKKPSKLGTIFSITFNPDTDESTSHRTFRCTCGNVADPCNLNIEIQLGTYDALDEYMETARNLINQKKNAIIDTKNKLLFGLITTETAIENFDKNKTSIDNLTKTFEILLDTYNTIFENPKTREELDQTTTNFYQNVYAIKECIRNMHENDDAKYAEDAAAIYATKIEPLLKKIRYLKYKENDVHTDDKNVCRLTQNKNTLDDIMMTTFTDKVIAYDVGLKIKIQNKKVNVIKGQEKEQDNEPDNESDKFKLKISTGQVEDENQVKSQSGGSIPEEDPIIGVGKDGISWTSSEYQMLWERLPDALKNEFKLNIDWMKEFMHKCVNMPQDKQNAVNCRLITPPNLVIPPREMDNGNYDFGVTIYNQSFNKQPKELQKAYLTYYKEDPITKVKDYTQLEDALNRLVETEVGYNKGFF